MRITRYSNADEWDDFVAKSLNGHIFGLCKFLNYHPPDRFEDHSLEFRDDKDRLVAVLPATLKEGQLTSHAGASYGGPILSRHDAETTFQVVWALVEYARNEGLKAVELRPPPAFCSQWPCESLDYALWRHGFEVVRMPLSSVIDLRNPLPMRSDTRRSLLKAMREQVKFRESDDWEAYWDILKSNLATKHEATPTHSLEEIKLLKSWFPDEIRLFGAYLEDKLIAGMVSFAVNRRALLAFYYATNYEYQDLRPLNLVISRVMDWGRKNHYRWLSHGVSTEEGGAVANWGLFRFKEGFGASGVVRRHWRKELGG